LADKAAVTEALNRHQSELQKKSNVVGFGIRKDKHSDGEALAVYVSKKIAPEKLGSGQLIPESLKIESGGRMVDVPIQVIDMGGEVALE